MRYALFIALAFAAAAQPQTRPNLMIEAGNANLPSQRLGVDDLLAVSVYDAPELTRTVRVETDGSIHLPMLHNGIARRRNFPRPARIRISPKRSTPKKILVDPVVKVTVVEYHSRPIAVMGAVKNPVTFQAIGTVTLLDALARAEGLTEFAGTEILLTRPVPNQVERIPLKRLMKDADPLRELRAARRRRDPRSRSRQDLRRRQRPQARSLPRPRSRR